MVDITTINEETIQYYIENKCSERGCWNFCERGYVLCEAHLHGFTSRFPDEIIAILKKREEAEA